MDTITGIKGMVGRTRVACALTVGKKGENGAPIEKDRFHILAGDAEDQEFKGGRTGTYKAPVRAPHPEYADFNKAGAAYRKSIPAALIHLTIPPAWEHRYGCNSGPVAVSRGIPAHPKKAQVCKGNGEIAERWNGKEYVQIPCPGDACPLRQPGPEYNGRPTKPPCGPWMRFIARFDWGRDDKVLPNQTFKFTSGGWHTAIAFKGFFEEFEMICKGFGVDPTDVPIFGMPIRLTLNEKTNKDTQSRFPTISVAYDAKGSKYPDMLAWIQAQLMMRSRIRQLAAASPVPALTDSHQQSDDVIEADVEVISAPSVPARAAA